MPEHRSWPYKFFPRRGVPLGVAFGEPIPISRIVERLSRVFARDTPGRTRDVPTELHSPTLNGNAKPFHELTLATEHDFTIGNPAEERASLDRAREGWMGPKLDHLLRSQPELAPPQKFATASDSLAVADTYLAHETARIRSAITAVIREEVEALGRRVIAEREEMGPP